MDVFWLGQAEADLPGGNDWLSASEIAFLEKLRFAERRASWRLGRWTAKRALAAYLKSSNFLPALAEIEIRPAASGAPRAFLDDEPAAATVSVSHREGRAICAVAPPAIDLGCDLELIEPHSDAFIADYFTAEEQALIARQPAADRPLTVALLWSAKESSLKALREGLRLDTRSVIVDRVSFAFKGWSRFEVRYTGGHIFHGWWQTAGNMVQTVVADPPAALPIALNLTAFRFVDRIYLGAGSP
jgi:4'-phosphopantetheinyl transferase